MAHITWSLILTLLVVSCVQSAQAGTGYIYDEPQGVQLNLPAALNRVEAQSGEAQLDEEQQSVAQIETQLGETQEGDLHLNDTQKPPAQMDFLDDLINHQKEQILVSILSGGLLEGTYSKGASHNKCASCTCGVPNINRIVGGQRVRNNKYPWIAQMLQGSFLFCGGTLINDRYVVTAAHCVRSVNMREITVRLLQFDRSSSDLGITRSISYALEHFAYNPATLLNDIALLKLNQPVPLVDTMRPVCLPNSLNQNFDHKQAIVAGWGLSRENGQTSSVLQEVVVPIITNAQCRATSYKSMIKDTMLCAGYVQLGGKDACQGDSGGPLIVRDKIFRLAGVVSFGYGCAEVNAPGVYTRVSRYTEWIASNTMDACYCRY